MLLLQLLLLLILLLTLGDTSFHRVEGVVILAEPRAGALRRPRAARRGVTDLVTAVIDQGVRRCYYVALFLLVRCDAERHAVLTSDLLRDVETVINRRRGGDAAICEYRIYALLHLYTPVLFSDFRQRRTT